MPAPTTPPAEPSTIKDLLAAGKALGAPFEAITTGREPYRIVPDGYRAEPIPHASLAPLPDHIRQRVTLEDVDSFATYVKRYQDARTVVFVHRSDKGAAEFEAVFDYHSAAKEGGPDSTRVQRCAHRAVYPCPFSVEWNAWRSIDGKQMAQEPFIDFLDANAADITTPSAADVKELALNFSAKSEVTFQSAISRTVKGVTLAYQENVQAGGGKNGSIQVPDALKLTLPIFEGGAPFVVPARLAWDPRGGTLKISVHLQLVDRITRQAIAALSDDIKAATGITPLAGTPA